MKYISQRFIFIIIIGFFAYNLLNLWNEVMDKQFNMYRFIAMVLVALGLLLVAFSYLRVILKMNKRQ